MGKPTTTGRTNKCIGLVGMIRGHKYKTGNIDVYFHDFCQRCGMPKGGWQNANR